jgi:hypothetical protein
MGRIALFLLLAFAVAVPAASSRSAADWKKLRYFDFASQQLVVATDEEWRGGDVVQTRGPQRPLSIPGPGLRKTQPEWLWTRNCGSSRQSVSFARSILAPGVPLEGYLNFVLGFGRDLPFRSGVFLVNGTEVAELTVRSGKLKGFPSEFRGALPKKALKAFKYGANTLTIRAERGTLPKGQRCNSPNRLVAAVADLRLRFLPDVVAVPSPLGPEQVGDIGADARRSIQGSIRFRNVGPSGSPGGKFVFDWSGGGIDRASFGPAGFSGGVRGCKFQAYYEVAGKLECEYEDLPVGGTLTVNVRGHIETPAKWAPTSTGELSMSWTLNPAGGDAKAGNNGSSHQITFCGPRATDPRCKKK